MQIKLDNISKRYDSGWVIRNFTESIDSGEKVAVLGPNGSGKSTLINILAGYLSPSKGSVKYHHEDKDIGRDNIFKHLAIATAYSELDEELNPVEIYNHFKVFKPYSLSSTEEFLDLVDLRKQSKKAVKYFSSGMKQRLALGLSICMDTPLLILDEPGSFLDVDRKKWYLEMMERFAGNKTIIVASNDPSDFSFCERRIELIAN